MPREICNKTSIDLETIFAPGRTVLTPRFDFTLLLFRPLPIPVDRDKSSRQLTPGAEGTNPGKWLGQDFVVSEFKILDRLVRVVLKHMNDSPTVLSESPIYTLHRYLRPYLSCLKSIDPKKSYYWGSINPKIYNYLKRVTPVFDTYNAICIQALVYAVQSTPQRVPIGLQGKSALVLFKKNGLKAFLNSLYSRDPANPIIDVVHPEKGKLVAVTRLGAKPELYPRDGVDSGSSYQVSLYDNYDTFTANLAGKEDLILSITDHWDNVFTLLTPEEQIELLLMSDIPPLVTYLALRHWDIKFPKSFLHKAKIALAELNINVQEIDQQALADEIANQDLVDTEEPPFDEDSITEGAEDETDQEDSEFFNVYMNALKNRTQQAPDPKNLLKPSKWTKDNK